MYRKSTNQSGLTRMLLVGAIILVFGVIGTAGYRAYEIFHEVKTVSYQGIFQKKKCTAATPGCTGYTLTTNDAKTYSLVLPSSSGPPPANNTKVAVTGTAHTSGSGQSTISVTKIQQVSTAPAPAPSPTPSSPIAPEPRPVVSYTGTLYFTNAPQCAVGVFCASTHLAVDNGQSLGLILGSSGAKFVNNEHATVTGNPDQKYPNAIDVISITPVQ